MALDYRPLAQAQGQMPTLQDMLAPTPMTPTRYNTPVMAAPTAVASPAALTPFQQDMAALFQQRQAEAARIRAQQDLVRGVGDAPGAGGLQRLWGYFTDSPERAAQRADNVRALDALRAVPTMQAVKAAPQKQVAVAQPTTKPSAAPQVARAQAPADAGTGLRQDVAQALSDMVHDPRGYTIASLAAAANLLPIATAPPKTMGGKDAAAYKAMQLNDAVYSNTLEQAKELAAQGDIEGAREARAAADKGYLDALKSIYTGGKTLEETMADQIAAAQGN